MATALSGSRLIINNETIEYMANSLKYDLGNAEVKVDPQVIGDGAVTNVPSRDFSTAKSKVMFDLKSTSENEEKVIAFIELFASNVIKIVSSDSVTRVFESATIINKPEFDTGADGVIPIEFECSVAVVG